MDDSLRHHADTLAADITELHELGFEGDELRQAVECLSLRAFARLGSRPSAAAMPTGETADDATPIG